jgi:hypothetical protein
MNDPQTFTGPGGYTFALLPDLGLVQIQGPDDGRGYHVPIADLRAFVDDLDQIKAKDAIMRRGPAPR